MSLRTTTAISSSKSIRRPTEKNLSDSLLPHADARAAARMMTSQLLDDYVFEILFLKGLTLIKPYWLVSGERRRLSVQQIYILIIYIQSSEHLHYKVLIENC